MTAFIDTCTAGKLIVSQMYNVHVYIDLVVLVLLEYDTRYEEHVQMGIRIFTAGEIFSEKRCRFADADPVRCTKKSCS